MQINVDGYPISDKEINAYQQRGYEKYGDKLVGMDIKILDKETAEIQYHVEGEPFERVRRITGYLVGTLDKWNNAKRAEEKDRVKHEV
jgi:hypothetical protein